MPTSTHGRVTLPDFASLCKAPRSSLCGSNLTEFETRLCDESSCKVLVMEDLFGKHFSPSSRAQSMCTPPCIKGCSLFPRAAFSSSRLAIPPCSIHATDNDKWQETGFQVESVPLENFPWSNTGPALKSIKQLATFVRLQCF